jgi:hypothetical protein
MTQQFSTLSAFQIEPTRLRQLEFLPDLVKGSTLAGGKVFNENASLLWVEPPLLAGAVIDKGEVVDFLQDSEALGIPRCPKTPLLTGFEFTSTNYGSWPIHLPLVKNAVPNAVPKFCILELRMVRCLCVPESLELA